MNTPDYDPSIASRDAYGNVTVEENREDCEHCVFNGTELCPRSK